MNWESNKLQSFPGPVIKVPPPLIIYSYSFSTEGAEINLELPLTEISKRLVIDINPHGWIFRWYQFLHYLAARGNLRHNKHQALWTKPSFDVIMNRISKGTRQPELSWSGYSELRNGISLGLPTNCSEIRKNGLFREIWHNPSWDLDI